MTSFPMRNNKMSKLFLEPFDPGKSGSSHSKSTMMFKNYKHEIEEHFGLHSSKHARPRRHFDWSVCKDRSITNEGLTDSGTRADKHSGDKHSGDKHSGDDVMFKVATKDPWHVRCSRCCNCNSSIAIGNLIYESSFCSRLCLTSWKVARYKRMFEGYEKHESKLELEAAVIAHRKSTGSTDSTDSESERVRHAPIDIPRHSYHSRK